MIQINDILSLHQKSIQRYGGSMGVRDMGLLESAINRPFQTFANNDLYPSAIEKAAALGESLIINHPFVDGNKRIGALAMYAFLMEHQLKIISSNNDFYEFVIAISTGSLPFDGIVDWLKSHTVPL